MGLAPMKITRIDLWHVAIPTPAPFYPAWIPGFPQTENRFTLVRLGTASGLTGWSAGPEVGRERSGLGSLLGQYLLGERADVIASIRQRVREMGYLGIRAGWLEPACWDIIGKAQRKPVHELLGSTQVPDEIELYASTGQVRRGRERVAEVEARLAEGFRAVKLRVHDATLEEDIAQVREVRRAVGDEVVLGVDANQGWRVAVVGAAPLWDGARALAFCKAMAALGVDWVEEPLAMDDYDGLATLRAASEIDIAGGELNAQGLPEFGVMLAKGCYDVYQPDAIFTGGIADTWRIIQKIKAAGARYTPHTWTNGIGFAVNLQLHLAARDPTNPTRLEYPFDPPGWVPEARDGILDEPWLALRGQLAVPTRPGLGFEIDRRALRRYSKHFFRASPVRVAVSAVIDKGVKVARELGGIRDARLAARDEELTKRGGDAWKEAL